MLKFCHIFIKMCLKRLHAAFKKIAVFWKYPEKVVCGIFLYISQVPKIMCHKKSHEGILRKSAKFNIFILQASNCIFLFLKGSDLKKCIYNAPIILTIYGGSFKYIFAQFCHKRAENSTSFYPLLNKNALL